AGVEPTRLAPAGAARAAAALSERHLVELGRERTQRLNAFAAERGVTVNSVLQLAWGLVLAMVTGQDEATFGATVSGRPAGLPGVESMVGLFINTIPVRVRAASTETLGAALARVQVEQADLLDHHYLGLADVQSAAGVGELFDTLLVFESYPVDAEGIRRQAADIDGMSVTGMESLDATHYPLTLLVQLGASLRIEAGYLRELFDADAIRVLTERLVRMTDAIVADPELPVGEVELLDAAEQAQVLWGWNGAAHPVDPSATLVSLFEAQAVRTPAAAALVFEDTALSYAEFASRVHRLARHLVALGVGPESLVALAMRRSLDLLVGVYAVQAAGGAYVPIDPDHPDERNAYVLDVADPVCVLTTGRDEFAVETYCPAVALDTVDVSGYADTPLFDGDRRAALRPEHPAYVIFTSGSTGRPKGVAVSHAAIVNRLVWMQDQYGLTPSDVVLQKTPATFDVSVWELFWPLQVGATLAIARPDGHRDPAYLVDAIVEHGVTTVHFVPSMLAAFVAEPRVPECLSLRRVFASGEALPGPPAQRMRALTPARVYNLYGPTEAAVDVTHHEVTAADAVAVPIGGAVYNTQLLVLDARLRPAPIGVAGELYLAGVQLARGYVSRADLTADRFVANPYASGATGLRMYRTGDLVRRNPNGELEYLGRTDFQVKLRGLRIELGEIEAALTAVPGIDQAAVIVRTDGDMGDRLVAYVVPASGDVGAVDVAGVKAAVAQRLPGYMTPDAFVALEAFPLNASGKLDRRALPAPVVAASEFRAPTTAVEQTVAEVFAEVLGLDRAGLDDDFFALGGNSLTATRVAARVSAALRASLGVRELFEAPTVAALAARLEGTAGSGSARAELTARPRPARVPLSLAQQRMWFLNRFDPDSTVDNIPAAVRLSGLLDRQALQVAVADVLARHESLRTVYPEHDGVGYQRVVSTAEVIPDLTPLEVSERELAERVRDFVHTAFDVTLAVPFRACLFELSPTEHVLAFVVHHISADGQSMGPLTRDVMLAYSARVDGAEPAWTPLEVQYADFALWQRAVLGAEDDAESLLSRQVSFWTEALAALPDQLDLPADRPRPAVASGRGAVHTFTVDGGIHRGMAEVARGAGATAFMV
ncbi:MAG: amino acid adenylation domain-containing protein, partial [Mycobacteriaceae bacterium]|nr:amino acid adenylation domain-containing protein [Mycobacteriaceae bacterium]